MAKSILRLGFHVVPTVFILLSSLRKHVERLFNKVEDDGADYPFPVVVDADLYSDDPWHVLNDEDSWIVHNCNDPRLKEARRSIFVFTELTILGRKRFVRTAGSGTWDGATGEKKIPWGDDGEFIGSRKYFDFKTTESSKVGRNGHWRMNEYRLAGEMLKGLENFSLATRIVLCEIEQIVDKSFGIHLGWTKTAVDEKYADFVQRGYLRRPSNDDGERKQLPDQEIEENLSMYNAVDGYSNKIKRLHDRKIMANPMKKRRIQNRKELTEDWSTINSDKWRTVSTMPHDSGTAQLGYNLELGLGKNHKENRLMTIEETDESTGDEMHTSNPSVGDQYQIARAPEAGLHGFQTAEDELVSIPATFYMKLLRKAGPEHREFAQELGLPVPAHQPSQFIEFF